MTTVRLDQGAIDRLFTSPAGPVGKSLARSAVKVEAAAIRLCPVDTGRLRSSITHQLTVDGQGLLALVGTNVEYAIFVELGTRFSPAQPFLRPALRAA
jgi:HK97 gp10 family phage protein